MATLNIKRFPDTLYEKLKTRAEEEHRSVTQQVVPMLSQAVEDSERRLSILELRGAVSQ